MKPGHALEGMLLRGTSAAVRAMPIGAARRFGAGLGDCVRMLGVRRAVAEANLAIAFPERSPGERRAILTEHYRELGRVACEYPRMGELVRAPDSVAVRAVRGLDHLEDAHAAGRGVILLTGHYGNFELLGAWLGRQNPVDFVVKPLSNPSSEQWIAGMRAGAGVGTIPLGAGVRQVFEALRRKRWVAMVADQDARSHGIFVPFFGRPSSTPGGPAAIALRAGSPIIMGFVTRAPDGRLELDVLPALMPSAAHGADAVRELTARHTACLEAWVRRHPPMWFWLHRRWKSAPRERTA